MLTNYRTNYETVMAVHANVLMNSRYIPELCVDVQLCNVLVILMAKVMTLSPILCL